MKYILNTGKRKCGCAIEELLTKELRIVHCSLHAAAPKLLEACKEADNQLIGLGAFCPGLLEFTPYRACVNLMKNAIAKAKGEV